jgi:A/G-specific adenine glycosylase
MLQQTQVDTVIPFFERFTSLFPTVEALAAAPLEEVLKAWENLGYYARARNLHAAAARVVTEKGGRIPATFEGLLGLPGIGAYTAGAILSIAFEQRVPALDGNVRRVLCRLFAVQEPLERSGTRRCIAELAAGLVPQEQPGQFNQGLMEIGAVLCRPRRPSCGACPLKDLCRAARDGLQEALPRTRKRGPQPHREMTAGIITDGRARLLLVQRPLEGLLGGLWKFPGGERAAGEKRAEALQRTVREELGVEVRVGEEVGCVTHAYTHFRMTLHAFQCTGEPGEFRPQGPARWLWAGRRRLGTLPLSRAERKVLDIL